MADAPQERHHRASGLGGIDFRRKKLAQGQPEKDPAKIESVSVQARTCSCGHGKADHSYQDHVWLECLTCADGPPESTPCLKFQPAQDTASLHPPPNPRERRAYNKWVKTFGKSDTN